jgi:hypothetical protein
LILAVAAVAALLIGGGVMLRNRQAENPAGETAQERAEEEREFEAAERYQEEWRKENRKEYDDEAIP